MPLLSLPKECQCAYRPFGGIPHQLSKTNVHLTMQYVFCPLPRLSNVFTIPELLKSTNLMFPQRLKQTVKIKLEVTYLSQHTMVREEWFVLPKKMGTKAKVLARQTLKTIPMSYLRHKAERGLLDAWASLLPGPSCTQYFGNPGHFINSLCPSFTVLLSRYSTLWQI